jgi:HD-GYP domain-containing protein (c-di-GMP phosphodiesterase class II)
VSARDFSEETFSGDLSQNYERLMNNPAMLSRVSSFMKLVSGGIDDLISDILSEMREATSADAASIYIADRDVLRFVYVQNETLESTEKMDEIFLGKTIEINEGSMCGYVAMTMEPLIVRDARAECNSAKFRLNANYDDQANYSTVSAITVPILDDGKKLAGVLQLINHKDANGEPSPFEGWMYEYVMLLVERFFPLLSHSFERYRDTNEHPWSGRSLIEIWRNCGTSRASDILMTIKERLSKSALRSERLPWLNDSGVVWTDRGRNKESNIAKRLLAFSHYVNKFEELGTIIEMMLTEARDATRADGGTFYLVTDCGRKLRFAYVQNDTLFSDNSNRNHYINEEVPIDRSSISGYVALEKQILNIPDVGVLPEDAPYSFNRSFDNTSGYKTTSVLTVPVLGSGDVVIAVIQLINCKNLQGEVKAFSVEDARYADLLSGQTMPYLTRSIMTRRLIETMINMSNLRDPTETGAHAHRVASLAAEIYHRWAENKKIDIEEIRTEKDSLRLAAMLHDIGKISVPDSILKKKGSLTEEEIETMRTHCAKGASMYLAAETRLERTAYEVTLHHHQRWDGKGYTGDPDIPPLAGSDIPIYARITSVADVLDALVFSRSYKPARDFRGVMADIRKAAGTQFDPEVVDAAEQVADVLEAIIARYRVNP